MIAKIVAFTLAILLTYSMILFVPAEINQLNDTAFGDITILDVPDLVQALRTAQAEGVEMCVHGWRHEHFDAISASNASNLVKDGVQIFNKAGLSPVAFLSPYQSFDTLPISVRTSITSTGIATSLPVLSTNGSRVGDYGWMWRTMKSFDDSRYDKTLEIMLRNQPTTITTHVEDWNIYLKTLFAEYLQKTQLTNITLRIDDIEVNTPTAIIYDMADMYKYNSLGQIAYAVIPSGTWRGGDPAILDFSVNDIFHSYWLIYLLTALFPFATLFFWRGMSPKRRNKKNPPNSFCNNENSGAPTAPDFPLNSTIQPKTKISIIVPAYNEEKNIAKCIEAMLKQTSSHQIEIILVNDGSTDKTRDIASKYPIKVINHNPNKGKATALNTGIENSTGDILIFSDSDSEIEANALNSIIEHFESNPDVQAIAGNVLINKKTGKRSLLRSFQEIEYFMEQEITRYLQSTSGKVLVCPGPLLAVRREVAEKIKFRDTTVIEDADFTVNLLKEHLKVVQLTEAKVYTNPPDSLSSWMRQRTRWWYGNLQLWRVHHKWAQGNSWMILNYLSFPLSALSIGLLVLLPFLLVTYDNINLVMLRAILWVVTPWLIFMVFTIPLFIKQRKRLILLLLPYYLIYGTMKVLLLSYLYLRYLLGIGIRVKFGPRDLKVK